MTDSRFQRDLNALVKTRKRSALADAPARGPVPGGSGYAGKLQPALLSTDQIWYPVPASTAVHRLGAPSGGVLAASVPVLETTTGALGAVKINTDIYTLHTFTGFPRDIRRNNVTLSTALTDIRSLSGNSTELLINEVLSDTKDSIVFLDRFTGAELRRLSGAAWMVAGDHYSLSQTRGNETHFCVPVKGTSTTAHHGYWLYENDFTYVTKIAFTTANFIGAPSFRDDRVFIVDFNSVSSTWRVRAFNLSGVEQGAANMPGTYNSYRDYSVTDFGMYMQEPAAGGNTKTTHFPNSGEVFDFTSPTTITETGLVAGGYVQRNQDFTLEY